MDENYIMTTEESISYINTVKVSGDIKEINLLIKELFNCIKDLSKEANKDSRYFKLIKYLNNILSITNTEKSYVCEQLNECLIKTINDIKYEKEVLLELKKYLKQSKKNKNYDDLDQVFLLLIITAYFNDCFKENYLTSFDIWKNSFKGINYFPPESINPESDEIKESLTYGLEKLKSKILN